MSGAPVSGAPASTWKHGRPALGPLTAAWERAATGGPSSSGARGPSWPHEAARLVLAAVLQACEGKGPGLGARHALITAGRGWAAAHGDPATMFERLSLVPQILPPLDDAARRNLHTAMTELTGAATTEALHPFESQARTDELTQVGNRRALSLSLEAAVAGARRYGHDLSVVAIDLDGLKTINDTEGHPAGDTALVTLVTSLKGVLRKDDQIFRTGGDEFVLVLSHTAPESVPGLMMRARDAGAPSFSWGVAHLGPETAYEGALLGAADADLYARRGAANHYEATRGTPTGSAGRMHRDSRRAQWRVVAAAVAAGLAAFVLAMMHGGSPVGSGLHAPTSPTTAQGAPGPAGHGASHGTPGPGGHATATARPGTLLTAASLPRGTTTSPRPSREGITTTTRAGAIAGTTAAGTTGASSTTTTTSPVTSVLCNVGTTVSTIVGGLIGSGTTTTTLPCTSKLALTGTGGGGAGGAGGGGAGGAGGGGTQLHARPCRSAGGAATRPPRSPAQAR